MNTLHNTTEPTYAKILISAIERQVSWVASNSEIVDY